MNNAEKVVTPHAVGGHGHGEGFDFGDIFVH